MMMLFDVIDHNISLNKFTSNNIPEHTAWSLDFLNGVNSLLKVVLFV